MFAKKGSRNFPPTPFRPLPLVGHLPHFARDPLRFLERAMEASGDIYTLNLGTVEMILLNHPDHSSHMLIDRAESGSPRPISSPLS